MLRAAAVSFGQLLRSGKLAFPAPKIPEDGRSNLRKLSAQPDNVRHVQTTLQRLHDQNTLSLAWMQKAAEYRALCYQAFNLASLRLNQFTQEPSTGKPKAIVVDVDETRIDNTPYLTRLLGKDVPKSNENFEAWVKDENAKALPGAVDFLNEVDGKGVHILYVTNRFKDSTAQTVNNLKKLGFPQIDDQHLYLSDGSSDKKSRRADVAEKYDVGMFLGDSLSDFDDRFFRKPLSERHAETDRARAEFGNRWIIFPNPSYGEWEGTIYRDAGAETPISELQSRWHLNRV